MSVPGHCARNSSIKRIVSRSRSFVGSSRKRTLGLSVSARSSCNRRRSPPERSRALVLQSAPVNQKLFMMAMSSGDPGIPRGPATSSCTVASRLKLSDPCSKYEVTTVGPCLTVPMDGSFRRASKSTKVDFPAPFGPTIPMRSPGPSSRLMPLRICRPFGYEKETLWALITV